MIDKSEDERIIIKQTFKYYFSFTKSRFILTNKRVVIEQPTLFLFIPYGKKETTYPINNISAVAIGSEFNIVSFIIGLILGFVGCMFSINSFMTSYKITGLTLVVLAMVAVFGSFRTVMQIVNNSGTCSTSLIVSLDERKRAQSFINKINTAIAQNN